MVPSGFGSARVPLILTLPSMCPSAMLPLIKIGSSVWRTVSSFHSENGAGMGSFESFPDEIEGSFTSATSDDGIPMGMSSRSL